MSQPFPDAMILLRACAARGKALVQCGQHTPNSNAAFLAANRAYNIARITCAAMPMFRRDRAVYGRCNLSDKRANI